MEGLDQLEGIAEQLLKDVEKLIDQVADQVPNVLKQRTPVDTGHLKRSWRSRQTTKSVTVRNTAFYAGFVEYGTSRSKAQPMLTPLIPMIESELDRAFRTGTDFNLSGGSFKDPVDQLREAYQAKYKGYGNQKSYRG
jgi:HK97 gp10 family phage protein